VVGQEVERALPKAASNFEIIAFVAKAPRNPFQGRRNFWAMAPVRMSLDVRA
jgi:hypothetical protein